MIKSFIKNESGATAIEYGLIAAIVGIGIIAVMKELRLSLVDVFQQIADALKV